MWRGRRAHRCPTPKATPAAAQSADLGAIKAYLLDHTQRLVTSVGTLNTDAQAYYDLAEVDRLRLRGAARRPARRGRGRGHEAAGRPHQGQPGLRGDGGRRGGCARARRLRRDHRRRQRRSDPESAVPFSFKTEDGREFKQPGNLFALVETSAFGTEPKFVAKGVEPDLDGDGKVAFPEALPDAQFMLAASTEFAKYAKELDAAAKAWEPKMEDAFTAVVVMTPTMSEYFAAWKNSRFIAGNDADEKGFVATSRLSDIRDILGGIVLIYDNVKPSIEASDPDGAEQTRHATQGPARLRRAPPDRGRGRQAVHRRGSRHARRRTPRAAPRRSRARCPSRRAS